jgi:hypothetical protein
MKLGEIDKVESKEKERIRLTLFLPNEPTLPKLVLVVLGEKGSTRGDRGDNIPDPADVIELFCRVGDGAVSGGDE